MYICACISACVCMYGVCTCARAHVHVCIFVNICIYVCVCMVCVCAVYPPPHIFLKRSFFYSENFYCQEIALSSALLPPTPPQLKIYWTVLEAKDIFSPAGPSGKWLYREELVSYVGLWMPLLAPAPTFPRATAWQAVTTSQVSSPHLLQGLL